jgi:hypothetical protein
MDKYLAFTDEAAAKAVLYRIEGAVEADPEQGIEAVEGYEVPNYANIDTLGILYERQEVTDPDNPPEPIPIPGWHVNVRVVEGEDPTALQPFAITPTNPRRIWG